MQELNNQLNSTSKIVSPLQQEQEGDTIKDDGVASDTTENKARHSHESDEANSSPTNSVPQPRCLSRAEESLINCFVDVALAFNLPRSIGEIFGMIYASPDPIPFETVKWKLGLSKASTSTGLKLLQKMGVIHTIYIRGDRRTFYQPEEDLDKAVGSLVEESILPHLRRAGEQVSKIRIPEEDSPLNQRLLNLLSWKPNLSIT